MSKGKRSRRLARENNKIRSQRRARLIRALGKDFALINVKTKEVVSSVGECPEQLFTYPERYELQLAASLLEHSDKTLHV